MTQDRKPPNLDVLSCYEAKMHANSNGRSEWSDERLNQLAALVESNAKLIESNAKAIEALANSTQEATNHLKQMTDSNARAIEAFASETREEINTLAEVSGRTLRAVELLREAQEEDRTNVQDYRERTDSLSAAVERLDVIVDYLIRRDQEGQDA